MLDKLGRNIDYMRVSVTERCNLRCKYCMPEGTRLVSHSDVLTYEELLRVCGGAAALGIVNFKITGGEPLVRRGCTEFIARLKALPAVEQVTLTTNGLLLIEHLDALCAAGLDAINISADTFDNERYMKLTGASGDPAGQILRAVFECIDRGIRTKINAVLLEETFIGIGETARLAQEMPVDVRFIELMPIGEGNTMSGIPAGTALARLREIYPDLRRTDEKRGNGPARYYKSDALKGRIGFIGAVSNKFCDTCNRVRLTATGMLKPCLCFDTGADIKSVLRGGCTDARLAEVLRECIENKPPSHCFSERQSITEHRTMNRIGG